MSLRLNTTISRSTGKLHKNNRRIWFWTEQWEGEGLGMQSKDYLNVSKC